MIYLQRTPSQEAKWSAVTFYANLKKYNIKNINMALYSVQHLE